MKLRIDIDCTPEEARAFFGMPSVEALNAKLMEEIQARMMAHVQAMDPETLAKAWMPTGAAWQHMTEAFTQSFNQAKTKK